MQVACIKRFQHNPFETQDLVGQCFSFSNQACVIAIFGARLLVAFAAPSLVFGALAHEAHPAAQTTASADESAILAENEAAMTKMMNDMAAKPFRRHRSRFRRHDGPAPSRRDRHGRERCI